MLQYLQNTGFPFQLVAEGKWGYKWIKWVKKLNYPIILIIKNIGKVRVILIMRI
jgi:hypothetical protein